MAVSTTKSAEENDVPLIVTEEENELVEDNLLKMLEEQNRLLEQDTRYTKQITRTESNTSSPSLDPLKSPQATPPSNPPQATPPLRSNTPPPKRSNSTSPSKVPRVTPSPPPSSSLPPPLTFERETTFIEERDTTTSSTQGREEVPVPIVKEGEVPTSNTKGEVPTSTVRGGEVPMSNTEGRVPTSNTEGEVPTSAVDQGGEVPTSAVRGGEVPAPPINEEGNEEEILSMWANVMKNWEESVKKNGKLIKQLVRKGIPDPLRGMAWQLLSGPHNEGLKKMYPSLITEEACPFEKQIKRDLDRTFPDHSFFKDRDGLGQESLLSVMKAYSLYDREVGYCQGSLFLAGELLMHMPEEETFCVFVQLMNKYKLRELYKPSMAKLSICFYQFESLLEELFPKLHMHFKALGFYTSMYSSSWFLTLFASTLSLSIAFRVMDIFLEEGLEIVFRIGLALMELSHDSLMSMDLEEMTKLLQKKVKTLHDANPDRLFETAFKIKLTSKKLKKLEKEYLLKKEKQATENSNISMLKEENENLEKRVMALEMECAALADKLIQGQVTRAQEEEELLITRREVFRLRKELRELKVEQSKWTSTLTNIGDSPSAHSRQLEVTERDRSISAPSLRDNLLSTPDTPPRPSSGDDDFTIAEHVSKEDAQQCLRELGISPTTTPTATPTTTSTVSVTQPNSEFESLLQELATTKVNYAEMVISLEQKSLELRGSLEREKNIREELEQARALIDSFNKEREETDQPSSPVVCPHCGVTYTPSKASLDSSKTLDDEERSSCPSQNEDDTGNHDNLTETLSQTMPTAALAITDSPSSSSCTSDTNTDQL